MTPTDSIAGVPTSQVRSLFWRIAWISVLWVGLAGLDLASWIVGAPAVLASAWLSLRLAPVMPWRLSWRGACTFGGYFLRESLSGGWDVARRSLARTVRLAPALLTYRTRLPGGLPRWFFCGAISLLPGTAVVNVSEARLSVHVLSASGDESLRLRKLEARVAALFGLRLSTEGGGVR